MSRRMRHPYSPILVTSSILKTASSLFSRKKGYTVRDVSRRPIKKTIETLEWDAAAAQKNGFEHFMLKEIMEIPDVIGKTRSAVG